MAAEVGKLFGAEDVLVFARRLIEGEEVGQGHAEDALQQFLRG